MKLKSVMHSTVLLIFAIVVLPLNTVTADTFDWSIVRDELVASNAPNETTVNENGGTGKGNSFVSALGAPFRAIGRMFRGKGNNQQPRRISQKEAAKFESSGVARINDAQSPPSVPAPELAALSQSEFESHLQRGRQLLVAGDLNGSVSELWVALCIKPKSAEVNNLLGIAYESKGLRNRALQAFEVAVQSDDKNPEYLNNYGFLLLKNQDYERATKYLKRAAKLSPKDARVLNNLALAQCQRGKFDEAYESFVKATGEFSGHVNIAAQLQSRGYAKDAIQHLEKAQALRPNSVDVITKLVALYDMTGRPTDAETARRSLVALKTFADANK